MKSIKLSDFLVFKQAKYVYLKITPDKSIRNYNSSSIVKAMSLTYKGLFQHIKTEGRKFLHFLPKKFIIEETNKFTYVIDIQKVGDNDNDISFYFIVPELFENTIREKISQVWSKATIENVESIKKHSNDSSLFQLSYKKQDGLSLKIDTKDNYPLNDILNVADIMKDGDRVTIYTNFMAIQQSFWKEKYKKTMNAIRKKEPLEKEILSGAYISKLALTIILGLVDAIQETIQDFLGAKNEKENKELNSLEMALGLLKKNDLHPSTTKKENATIIKNQIVVVSESKDKVRQYMNGETVCQNYNIIKEDNELIYRPTRIKNFNPEQYDYKVNSNFMSIEECHNFVQLAGKDLQQKYSIKSIKTLEVNCPKELLTGVKRLGLLKCKDTKQMVYFTTDKDYKNLAVIYCAPSRSGKTTALINNAKDCIDAGESIVILDFVETCQFSEEVKANIPKDKIIEIDLSDLENIEGFGYNEITPRKDDVLYIYDSAKRKANQLKRLVEGINGEGSEFTDRMSTYLMASALVGFCNNMSVKEVFEILEKHKVREQAIKNVRTELKQYLEDSIESLMELNEVDKEGNIKSTKLNLISGIKSRIGTLKENTIMELMLKKDTKNNINIYEEIQKGKAIFIKMPEASFGTPEERDIISMYYLTKLWLALQIRADLIPDKYKRTTVNIFIDELGQLDSSQRFIGTKLSQIAKFGGKFIISCMYLNELKIRDKLRNANTSYIFISGADKKNFFELKDEFEQFGFELEDMLKMERFESLNYVKYGGGYSAFISKLPPELK